MKHPRLPIYHTPTSKMHYMKYICKIEIEHAHMFFVCPSNWQNCKAVNHDNLKKFSHCIDDNVNYKIRNLILGQLTIRGSASLNRKFKGFSSLRRIGPLSRIAARLIYYRKTSSEDHQHASLLYFRFFPVRNIKQ